MVSSFRGLKILVVPKGGAMTVNRLGIWIRNLKRLGATVSTFSKFIGSASYVVVDEKLEQDDLLQFLGLKCLPIHASFYTEKWLTEGLRPLADGIIRPCAPHMYRYSPPRPPQERSKGTKRRLDGESGTEEKEEELQLGQTRKRHFYSKLACQISGNRDAHNFNGHLTSIFDELVEIYTVTRDRHREFSYKKVSGILKALDYKVNLYNCDELKHKYKGIGAKTIEKFREIIKKGRCSRLDRLLQDGKVVAAMSFCKIHGVGPKTAWELAEKYRSIEELRARGLGDLSHVSRIALPRYEDLVERIPREEVLLIEDQIKEAVHQLMPGAEITTCGSYRRGKQSCGDGKSQL